VKPRTTTNTKPILKPTQDQLLNIIVLKRVSTDRQDVQHQERAIEDIRRRWRTHTLRTEDLSGVSGTETAECQKVLQIMDDLGLDNVHAVAIPALDRLLRPAKDWTQWGLLQYFVNHGKIILSAREGWVDPSTREGRELCLRACGRAGDEWLDLLERTTSGRLRAMDRGDLDHGSVPYGYRYISKHLPDGRRWEIVRGEDEVVKEVFLLRRKGWSSAAIATELNRRRIPTKFGTLVRTVRKGHGHGGLMKEGDTYQCSGRWRKLTIDTMLANTAYYGEHKRCGRVWQVPAILDRAVFDAAQARRDAVKSKWVGRPSGERLLAEGRAHCARCNHRLITQYAKGVARYRCGHVERNPARRLCPASGVGAIPLETAAWKFLWARLTDAGLLLESARQYYAIQPKQSDKTLRAKEAEMRRLQQHATRVLEMVEERLMDVAAGKAKIQADEIRIELLTRELREAGRVAYLPPLKQAEAALREIANPLDEPATCARRRRILDTVVDLRITWDGSGGLEIQGFVPLLAAQAGSQNGTDCQAGPVPSASLIPLYGRVAVATHGRAA
jgi:DNA invertase Pin-like site-specific DNA recombinase